MQLIPVILCGGAGSRLWPVSRALHPKPFIRLADGQSLLQKTFLRASLLPQVKEILTVTNRDLFFKTADEYRETKSASLPLSYILEPFGRNTAAAIAAAAVQMKQMYSEDAFLLILPSDHLIADQEAFALAVDEAVQLAKQDKIVTFGIHPSHPETGYGYIESEGNTVYRFVEKPSLEKAQEYLDSGRFLWNSGMFCFKISTLLREMQQYCAAILKETEACLAQSRVIRGDNFTEIQLDPASFERVPDNSIDYALIEQSEAVAVVPCQIGWNDIGSWNSLGALVESDAQGNRLEAEAVLHDVSNCYLRSQERLIAAVGVNDLFVIDTPDALLIARKSHAQDIKSVFSQLKQQDHVAHKLHRTVHRPWGTYTVLEEGSRFKIKRIEVRPGASLSLQMHYHRSEHWIIVSGVAKVIIGEEERLVNTNESTYVPAGFKHRLENPGLTTLVMIEVQSGEYMGEDDIVRFQDVYGRV